MTHPRHRLLQAFMGLCLVAFIVFSIRDDAVMAATFLFGYLGVAAWWERGRR